MNGSLENSVDELTVHDASPDQNECCGNHGICSHQVLGDETPKPIANSAYKMVTRKVILPQFIFFYY
jgi:NAD+ kinase